MLTVNGYACNSIVYFHNNKYGVDKNHKLHKINDTDTTKLRVEKQLFNISHNFNEFTIDGLRALCSVSGKDSRTFFILFMNRDVRTNVVNMSHKELASKLHVSSRTIINHLNDLKNINLIKTAQNCIYINPNFSKGSVSLRKKLMKEYINRPMDSRHKVIANLDTYSKVQLKNIAKKIINQKTKEFNVQKNSKKTVWIRMLDNAIKYVNHHYSQYGLLNSYMIKKVKEQLK